MCIHLILLNFTKSLLQVIIQSFSNDQCRIQKILQHSAIHFLMAKKNDKPSSQVCWEWSKHIHTCRGHGIRMYTQDTNEYIHIIYTHVHTHIYTWVDEHREVYIYTNIYTSNFCLIEYLFQDFPQALNSKDGEVIYITWSGMYACHTHMSSYITQVASGLIIKSNIMQLLQKWPSFYCFQ